MRAEVPQHIASMSDNLMRLAFGEGELDPRYQKFVEEFQIINICVDECRNNT